MNLGPIVMSSSRPNHCGRLGRGRQKRDRNGEVRQGRDRRAGLKEIRWVGGGGGGGGGMFMVLVKRCKKLKGPPLFLENFCSRKIFATGGEFSLL